MLGRNGTAVMTSEAGTPMPAPPEQWRVKRPGSTIQRSVGERVFDSSNVLFMWIMMFSMLYPFWYVLILSLNEGRDAALGGIYFWPRKFTLDNYQFVLANPALLRAYFITISRTVTGSVINLIVSGLVAYSISKRHLPGRAVVLTFFMIPMFIGGTVVSTYIVYAKLGMLDTFWVYILPGAFGFFNMIIIRTFIYGLPISMEESAKLDGAGYLRIFFSIVIPLCMPVIAVILLFNSVGHWLDFSTNLIYVTVERLRTAQFLLYQIVLQQRISALMEEELLMAGKGDLLRERLQEGTITPHALQMATLLVVTLPILFVYPFVQRYFIQGVRIGAIKE